MIQSIDYKILNKAIDYALGEFVEYHARSEKSPWVKSCLVLQKKLQHNMGAVESDIKPITMKDRSILKTALAIALDALVERDGCSESSQIVREFRMAQKQIQNKDKNSCSILQIKRQRLK